MAHYHYHQGYVQRSQGASVVSHAAYIAATTLKDQSTGRVRDYSAKERVALSRILALNRPEEGSQTGFCPEGGPPAWVCPEWVFDREKLWNHVEAFEDQLAYSRFKGHADPLRHEKSLKAREDYLSTAQTGLKVRGSVPIELTFEEAQEAVEKFLRTRFVSRNLVVDYSLHWDPGNPHFHALVTLRPLQGSTFSETKDREICSRDSLKASRQLWEDIGNEALEKAGHPERWTCKSYEDLGLEVVPTHHRGWYGDYLEKQGLPSRIGQDNQAIREENVRLFLEKPQEIIKLVAQQKTVFTHDDIAKEIFKRVGDDLVLLEVIKKRVDQEEIGPYLGCQSNNNLIFEGRLEDFKKTTVATFVEQLTEATDSVDLIKLGPSVTRQATFVLKSDQDREERVITTLTTLLATPLPDKLPLEDAIASLEARETLTYSSEQRLALTHLAHSSQLSVLTGRAGTGKTTLLKPLVEAYEAQGFRVRGAAFQGKITDVLQRELGIESFTLDYWGKRFEALDEATAKLRSALDGLRGRALGRAQQHLAHLKAFDLHEKDVLIIDEANMIGIHHWDMILKRVADKGTRVIVAQDTAQIKPLWGADISRILEEKGKGACLTQVYRQKHEWMREASVLLNQHKLEEGLTAYQERGCLMFHETFTQTQNRILEAYFQALTHYPNQVTKILAFQNKHVEAFNDHIHHHLKQQGKLGHEIQIGGRTFYEGACLLFTENDTQGAIKTVSGKPHPIRNGTFGILESCQKETVRVRVGTSRVTFNREVYQKVQLGYALTIHKAEGETFDRVIGLSDVHMTPNHWLILSTRHREHFEVHIPQDPTPTLAHVVQRAGNSDFRLLVRDYTVTPEKQPYFEKVQQYRDVCLASIDHLHTLHASNERDKTAAWEGYDRMNELRRTLALDVYTHWKACEPFVHQAGIHYHNVAYHAGLREKPLTALEVEALERVRRYQESAHETRALWEKIQGDISEGPSSHPLWESYQAHQAHRNSLAYEIATYPDLHRPFFKRETPPPKDLSLAGDSLKRAFSPDGEDPSSVSQGAASESLAPPLPDQRSYGLPSALKHAAAYIAQAQQDHFVSRLAPSAQEAFEMVKTYRQATRDFAALYQGLETVQQTAVTPEVHQTYQKKLEAAGERRDQIAYTILLDYERFERYQAILGIKEDVLLQQACRGEVRALSQGYLEARTLEERLEKAQALKDLVYGPHGTACHKTYYGIARTQGIDFQQLTLEIAYGQQKPEPPLSLEALKASYASLVSYRALHRQTRDLWTLISTSAIAHVQHLQEEALKTGGQELSPRLKREALEEEAMARLGVKSLNSDVLRHTTEHILRGFSRPLLAEASSSEGTTDAPSLSPLYQVQHQLEARHSSYLTLTPHQGVAKTWQDQRRDKLKEAHGISQQYGALLDFFPAYDARRLRKESLEYQAYEQVKHFQESQGLDKILAARALVAMLEARSQTASPRDPYPSLLQRQLKNQQVPFNSLYLYSALQKDQIRLSPSLETALETYISHNRTCAQILQELTLKASHTYAFHQALFTSQMMRLRDQLLPADFNNHLNYGLKNLISQTIAFYRQTQDSLHTHEKRSLYEKKHLERFRVKYDLPCPPEELSSLQESFHLTVTKGYDFDRLKNKHISEALKKGKEGIPPLYEEAHHRNSTALTIWMTEAYGWDVDTQPAVVKKLFEEALRYSLSSFMRAPLKPDPESLVNRFLQKAYQTGTPALKETIRTALKASPLEAGPQSLLLPPTLEPLSPASPSSPPRPPQSTPLFKGDIPEGTQDKRAGRQRPPQPFYAPRPSFVSRETVFHHIQAFNNAIFFEPLAQKILGHPKKKGYELRYKGGLIIHTQKRTWYNFTEDTGGQAYGFIKAHTFLTQSHEILAYGLPYLAEPTRTSLRAYLTEREEREAFFNPSYKQHTPRSPSLSYQVPSFQETSCRERDNKLKSVQELYTRSLPIVATQAQRYLETGRHIYQAPSKDIRYIGPRETFTYGDHTHQTYYGAMLAFGRNAAGDLTAVQLTPLYQGQRSHDRTGQKYPKKTFGIQKGSFVSVQESSDKRIALLAEGVETALSLKEAGVTASIYAGLGLNNLSNFPYPYHTLILCADYDGPEAATHALVQKNRELLQDKGYQVIPFWPTQTGTAKCDFNDILIQEGSRKIHDLIKELPDEIQKTLFASSSFKPGAPLHPLSSPESQELLTPSPNTQEPPSPPLPETHPSYEEIKTSQDFQKPERPLGLEKALAQEMSQRSSEDEETLARIQRIQEAYPHESDPSKRQSLFQEIGHLTATLSPEASRRLEETLQKAPPKPQRHPSLSLQDQQALSQIEAIQAQYAQETDREKRHQLFQEIGTVVTALSPAALHVMNTQAPQASQPDHSSPPQPLNDQQGTTSLKPLEASYASPTSLSLPQEDPSLQLIEHLTTQLSHTTDPFKREALLETLESTLYELQGASLKAFEANTKLQDKIEKEAPHLSRSQSQGPDL